MSLGFVFCSPLHLLSPCTLKRSLIRLPLINTFHLALCWMYEMFLYNWKCIPLRNINFFSYLELCPRVALHWLFIRQIGDEMKELVLCLGTQELNWDPVHYASSTTHLYQLKWSSVATNPQFPFISSYQVCAALQCPAPDLERKPISCELGMNWVSLFDCSWKRFIYSVSACVEFLPVMFSVVLESITSSCDRFMPYSADRNDQLGSIWEKIAVRCRSVNNTYVPPCIF